jgi:hypothetical protein
MSDPTTKSLHLLLKEARPARTTSAPSAAAGIDQHAVDRRTLALTPRQLHSLPLRPRAGHNAC